MLHVFLPSAKFTASHTHFLSHSPSLFLTCSFVRIVEGAAVSQKSMDVRWLEAQAWTHNGINVLGSNLTYSHYTLCEVPVQQYEGCKHIYGIFYRVPVGRCNNIIIFLHTSKAKDMI